MSDYIPDYTDQYQEYEAEQEARLENYPRCDCCGEPILDEYFYDIDGTYFHENCLKEEFRKKTEDYMED